MNFIFFGSTRFSTIVLNELKNAGYIPSVIICAPDTAAGRGKKLTPPSTKIWAQQNNIKFYQPENLKNYTPEPKIYTMGIMASYGFMVPKKIIDFFPEGILNVHPSLLPKYRGPSPIQTAILNGDTETGVTIMLTDEEMDHGPILAQEKTVILPIDTYTTLHDKLALQSGALVAKTTRQWLNNNIQPAPQNHSHATYTKLITKQDGHINWQKSAIEIDRQIRAFVEWPTSFTFWDKKRLTIIKARIVNHESGIKNVGAVILFEKGFAIICGEDALAIEFLKLEGKKEITAEEFLRGHANIIGITLN